MLETLPPSLPDITETCAICLPCDSYVVHLVFDFLLENFKTPGGKWNGRERVLIVSPILNPIPSVD